MGRFKKWIPSVIAAIMVAICAFAAATEVKAEDEELYYLKDEEPGILPLTSLAVPELTHTVNIGLSGIKVSWNKVDRARGYVVFRRQSRRQAWQRIGATANSSFSDMTVKANTTYYYTVCGYIKTSNGKTRRGRYDEDGIAGIAKVTSRWKGGLKFYYDTDGNLITDVEDIIGSKSSYYLEVDYDKNIVTVYAKDGNSSSYNVPVKAFVCSTGNATPRGTFYTPVKYRWKSLNGGLWGQWCTRIYAGFLFHSVYYHEMNNTSISRYAYNLLGTKCSHGCVRLCCRDSKWIYDHCKLRTKVTIKHNARNPFGKPVPIHLRVGHRWDPTDPTAHYLCKAKGCHKNVKVGEP